jgi:hypothetical protein
VEAGKFLVILFTHPLKIVTDMQLVSLQYKIGDEYVYATFKGNIFKLMPTESFELSFSRLGGKYLPEKSGPHGSVWVFPKIVNAEVLELIISNTCFECGGLMHSGFAYDNGWISFDDFGGDAGEVGTTMSKSGTAVLKKVRKCQACGHSHT